MKSKNVLLVYLSALIGGILLMLLHNQVHLFEGIVVTCGILFIVPCSYILLSWIVTLVQQKSKKRSKTSETERRLMSSRSMALAGADYRRYHFRHIAGVHARFLCQLPHLHLRHCDDTLRVGSVGLHSAGDACAERQRLVVAASHSRCRQGIVVLILGPDKIKTVITMLTGIVLTVYGIEGVIGYIYRQSRLQTTEIMNHHYPIDAAAPKAKK